MAAQLRLWLFVMLALVYGLAFEVAHWVPAEALEVEFITKPVKRDILALYDSRHESKPDETRIHRLAEMPLNWLGFKVTYVDVNGELPTAEALATFRGVITWFVEPLQNPGRTLNWLDAATASGLRYACLAEIAPPEPPDVAETVERILGRLGLRASDEFVSVTTKVKIAVRDASMVGFERPIDKVVPEFRVMQTTSSTTTVHLTAEFPGDDGTDNASVLIATGPGGGYAADAFTIFYDAVTNKARWTLNPFAFFQQAFGNDRFPIPDVTTLSGRRIYFSHIDGDGWNNISEIEGYREAQVSAADVILKEIIAAFPDLPVSVGLIAGDAVPELGGLLSAQKSARQLYRLPQVEVATHTYTHPFNWSFYENYDRAAELAMIEKASRPALSVMEKVRSILYQVAGKSGLSGTESSYVAGSADLPRGYLKDPFDLQKEVQGALNASERYAPPGKKTAIYLWSGDAEPFEAAIKATRVAGVRNMNGGDSRLDSEFPSVFYVPPISRPVGAERQIYAANSNENTYTNYWHGPYYGQMMLNETLQNTEQPRRLKPFNLYYHMYSGEKAASLAAVKSLVVLAKSSPVIPITASHYAAIADDFFGTMVEQADANRWIVSKRGNLQTLRFDDAGSIMIDVMRSDGVLGSTRVNNSLYIALDPTVEPAVIVLAKSNGEVDSYVRPQLVESRWQVSDLKIDGCSFSTRAEGFGSSEMSWRVEPQKSFDIEAVRKGAVVASLAAASDANGLLQVNLQVNAIEPLDVRATCHDR